MCMNLHDIRTRPPGMQLMIERSFLCIIQYGELIFVYSYIYMNVNYVILTFLVK